MAIMFIRAGSIMTMNVVKLYIFNPLRVGPSNQLLRGGGCLYILSSLNELGVLLGKATKYKRLILTPKRALTKICSQCLDVLQLSP